MTDRKKAPVWTEAQKKPSVREKRPEPSMPKLLECSLLSEIEPEFVKWLWYPYIPAGKLTLIEGDPGLGKSWITCAIAKCIAGGERLPGMHTPLPPQKILLASAEDGLADTLVPRLIAMNANLSNIFHIDSAFVLDKQGIRALEATMVEYAAAVVFIDPLVAYLGGKMDMNKANEVREVMEGLSRVAIHTGAAIIAVRHLRKAGGRGKEIYAGIGSIDFTAAARSVMSVTETKMGDKIISHIKHNLTPKGRAMRYTLGEPQEDPNNPGQYGPGSFEWGGWYEGAEELESLGPDNKVCTTSKKTHCETFIFDMLRDGSLNARDCRTKLLQADYKMSTIKLAKHGLVVSHKTKDGWVWDLKDREGIDSEKTTD